MRVKSTTKMSCNGELVMVLVSQHRVHREVFPRPLYRQAQAAWLLWPRSQPLGGTLATQQSFSARLSFAPEEFVEGADRDHEACRSLWVAVIHKAMKDLAYACAKGTQPALTPSEREKLQRIHELDTPEAFFHSNWFEEICRNLELSASRIRSEILARYAREARGRAALTR
jgi:hypothetical protein